MSRMNTFRASCHCGASTLSFTVPTSSLPIPVHFCHCSICRHTHGTLSSIHASIPAPAVDLSTFTAYASSEKVVRYFCSTCGAHMLDKAHQEGKEEWNVAVSLVDAAEQVWDFREHIFLESTGDGGLASWLQEIGSKKLETWNRKPTSGAEFAGTGDWTRASSPSHDDVRPRQDALKAACHCGGVEFYIARPSGDSVFDSLPDSLTPRDKSKWYASTDLCTSCRLVTGSAIISWVFPVLSHITLADGSPYTPVFGTAKLYSSSADVKRTFCGTCGATVTYACDERPDMVDVAVGLLEGNSAMVEEWLEWRTHKLSWEEDCVWSDLVEGLKGGMTRWGDERGRAVDA